MRSTRASRVGVFALGLVRPDLQAGVLGGEAREVFTLTYELIARRGC